jgi:hypothetical protein
MPVKGACLDKDIADFALNYAASKKIEYLRLEPTAKTSMNSS